MTTSRFFILVAAMFVLLAAVALEIDRQSHRATRARAGAAASTLAR